MKKLIMALTAIVAASMIFVSCGDGMGSGTKDKGTKWDKTFFVDATETATPELTKSYRRAWKQLGTSEDVAGIVTTITIKKDGLTATGNKTSVVGLMFDYNLSAGEDGTKDKAKRDFGILGVNMNIDGSHSGYYLCKYENLPFDAKASLDSFVGALEYEEDDEGAVMVNGKNKIIEGVTCTDLTDGSNGKGQYTWIYDNDFYQELATFDFKDDNGVKKDTAAAYQFVVKVWPSLDENGNPDGNGYDVFIGKDKDNLKEIDSKPYTSNRDNNKKKIKIGGVEYPTLRGGICMYASAKLDTKVVANYKTNPPIGGRDNIFPGDEDFNGAELVGNLQLVEPDYLY